jgi:hypothetical protein
MPKKAVYVKQIKNPRTYDRPQINIKKSLDDDKVIKPEKIFEGYKKSSKKK